MRYEQLGKFRLVMERTHDSGLIEPHYFGHCSRGHRRKATRLAGQAALTKEVPLLMESDHGFLALLGNHGDLSWQSSRSELYDQTLLLGDKGLSALGQRQTVGPARRMSALPAKADILGAASDVR